LSAALPYRNGYEQLDDELRALDLLIGLRIRAMSLRNQASPHEQLSRTVYIAQAEVAWLLNRHENATEDPGGDDAEALDLRRQLSRLRREIEERVRRSREARIFLALEQLVRVFSLSEFERQALVICLAPELRRKYDRLYAYLQDDILRKRPSVDLILELLCENDAQRWSARLSLSESTTLMRAGLLRTVTDPSSASGSSGLARILELDARVCDFLLGGERIDPRLAGIADLTHPGAEADSPPVDASIASGAAALVDHFLQAQASDRRKLVVHLHGPDGVGKRALATFLCRKINTLVLTVDATLLAARGPDAEGLLRVAFREGLLQGAIVYLKNVDALQIDSSRALLKAVEVAVSEFGWLVLLSSLSPWARTPEFGGATFHSVALPIPEVPVRTAVWERCLEHQTSEAKAWAAELAGKFRLTPGQIQAAVELTGMRRLETLNPEALSTADFAASCRAQSTGKLNEVCVKTPPRYGWDDLVLPEDKLSHLREICNQVRHKYRVFGTWGFGKKLHHGRGLSILFTGPSGTGKTMSAQVLARELQLDLYKADLSGVVSKYIGETERNLNRIFEEAETSNAILFFDEADALFGKRTEVADAHDRYANIETSYLLQKMEEYEGAVILATNLRDNMDEAFTRRIRFIVDFQFPDEANRLRIWRAHLPREAPVSEDIDYGYLARELQLAGGSIRNIVLNSAFLAAGDTGEIGMEHLLRSARREFEKMGKFWNAQRALRLPAPRNGNHSGADRLTTGVRNG
jgi:SpoVK/Ycf46/Vps4 family AAA+-type ATPase